MHGKREGLIKMTTNPVTKGSVYFQAHRSIIMIIGWSTLCLIGSFSAFDLAFEPMAEEGPLSFMSLFYLLFAIIFIVFFLRQIYNAFSSPVSSILPQGLVFHARSLIIPWDKVEKVVASKNSIRIQTVHDFLPEPALSNEKFFPLINEDSPGTFEPVINVKMVNRSRESILVALTHYIGECNID